MGGVRWRLGGKHRDSPLFVDQRSLAAVSRRDPIPVGGLLERQGALAELAGIARRSARGEGRVVLLRGEAGVGKTAVIARFIAGLDQRTRVLRGWCDALSAPRPLGPL